MTDRFAYVRIPDFEIACEALFRPQLRQLPVVVVGDGAVIAAASPAARELGFSCGQTWFSGRAHAGRVIALAANEALYADLDCRFVDTLQGFGCGVEAGDRDGAYLNAREWLTRNRCRYAGQLLETIERWVGLSGVAGLGSTKTLAYLAARSASASDSVVSWPTNTNQLRRHLLGVSIDELPWIAFQEAQALRQHGLENAWDLWCAPSQWIRRQGWPTVERVHDELNGRCRELISDCVRHDSAVTCTRDLHPALESLEEVYAAVRELSQKAVDQLREQGRYAAGLRLFVTGAGFRLKPRRTRLAALRFRPSNQAAELSGHALGLLKRLCRKDYRYGKIGLVLTPLVSGPGRSRPAAGDLLPLSNRSTTRWEEIPAVG